MANFIEPSSTPALVAEYFKALGGGSRDDMADPPKEDDDIDYEKKVEVIHSTARHNYLLRNFLGFCLHFSLIYRLLSLYIV